LASLKFFIAGIFSGIVGLHIFNALTASEVPKQADYKYLAVVPHKAINTPFTEKFKPQKLVNAPQIQAKYEQPDMSDCKVIATTATAEQKVKFSFKLGELQNSFPDTDLASMPEQNLKDFLVTTALDPSKDNLQRIESLAALKLLDDNPLSSELVDQVISDLPKFIAENDSPSAVEALMLIEDDVQEYQFYQLLELNQSEDIDIRMATIFAIANADPYRQNKHVFDQLYKHDKSQMVRDTAYNILKNEYSDK